MPFTLNNANLNANSFSKFQDTGRTALPVFKSYVYFSVLRPWGFILKSKLTQYICARGG